MLGLLADEPKRTRSRRRKRRLEWNIHEPSRRRVVDSIESFAPSCTQTQEQAAATKYWFRSSADSLLAAVEDVPYTYKTETLSKTGADPAPWEYDDTSHSHTSRDCDSHPLAPYQWPRGGMRHDGRGGLFVAWLGANCGAQPTLVWPSVHGSTARGLQTNLVQIIYRLHGVYRISFSHPTFSNPIGHISTRYSMVSENLAKTPTVGVNPYLFCESHQRDWRTGTHARKMLSLSIVKCHCSPERWAALQQASIFNRLYRPTAYLNEVRCLFVTSLRDSLQHETLCRWSEVLVNERRPIYI